ncbi:MAG TPA: hypothetical protein VH593_20125, partial [Ktedonobacteraceae bacterium]
MPRRYATGLTKTYGVGKTGPEIPEEGEYAMRNGKSFLLITIVVLLLLVLLEGTLDGIALTHSGWMGKGGNQMMGTQQGYPRMMGTQHDAAWAVLQRDVP